MNIITPQILKIILFEAAIMVITGAIKRKRVKPLTPAQRIIGNTGAKVITAVPKTGWFKTKNDDKSAIKIGIKTI